MKGQRVDDVENPQEPHPQLPEGGYRREKQGETWVWMARPPGTPHSGSLRNHDVTEHEDGTITVEPSILIRSSWAGEPYEWHGWLRAGEWSEG